VETRVTTCPLEAAGEFWRTGRFTYAAVLVPQLMFAVNDRVDAGRMRPKQALTNRPGQLHAR
jgi:hypothetical protein